MSGGDWTTANQRLLVAEFARIKGRLTGEESPQVAEELEVARVAMRSPAAIDLLSEAFGLSAFERDVLLLCAGVEFDRGLSSQCTNLSSAVGSPKVSFGMALEALDGPHWSAIAPVSPLRRFRLLQVHDDRRPSSSRLDLDERILHFLAGLNYFDPRLEPLIHPFAGSDVLARSHELLVDAAYDLLRDRRSASLQLIGTEPRAHLEIASCIAARLGLRTWMLRSGDIPSDAHEADAVALLWTREARLIGGMLVILAEWEHSANVRRFAHRVGDALLVTAERAVEGLNGDILRIHRPSSSEQRDLWKDCLGARAEQLNGALDAVVDQFRFGAADIAGVTRALSQELSSVGQLPFQLWKACRERVHARLDDFAERIQPAATWQDLVLPQPQLSMLRQIAAQCRQRSKVYEKWGFARASRRGLGISVLFSGESGTGKTMAAEVLANELRLDLYRIDLATIVNKYIGETEKNLRRVFDAAEAAGAILLFDEADALFGKRSDVKDSQDRFANIEVSYLLQKMESYCGLAILTTNLKSAIDAAFLRRLRFIVTFPFPNHEQRARIWQGAFPPDLPRVWLDFRKLAQLNATGGSIRNIAMNAAFLAADADMLLDMEHLVEAARTEGSKKERPYSDAEMRGWV